MEGSRDVWRSLYQYEDVSEINRTLQAFTTGLNDDGKLDLNNSSFVQSLKNRLGKAKLFFVSSANEKLSEEQKRSALMWVGCGFTDWFYCSQSIIIIYFLTFMEGVLSYFHVSPMM